MNFNYKAWSELKQVLEKSPTVGIDGHSALKLLEDIATLNRQVNILKEALGLIQDGAPWCDCMDTANIARKALEKVNKV